MESGGLYGSCLSQARTVCLLCTVFVVDGFLTLHGQSGASQLLRLLRRIADKLTALLPPHGPHPIPWFYSPLLALYVWRDPSITVVISSKLRTSLLKQVYAELCYLVHIVYFQLYFFPHVNG